MSKQLIITGMHRSGTSLVTNVLQKAGVHIGKKLFSSYKGNSYGYFEDYDFLYLHENIFRRYGKSALTQTRLTPDQITTEERGLVLSLIEQRKAYQLWGWKDPRTSLMLEFWRDLLPDARYIFIYRHPLEVTLSLVRRGMDIEVLAAPQVGLEAWHTYNQAILDFYQRYPENCVLCNIYGLVSNIPSFINLVAEKFDLPLYSNESQELFDPGEFHQSDLSYTSEIMGILEQISPDVVRLYHELDKQADLPDLSSKQGERAGSPRQETLGKISDLRARLTLQKIHPHLLIYELLALLDPDTISGIALRAKALGQDYHQIKTDYMKLLLLTNRTAPE